MTRSGRNWFNPFKRPLQGQPPMNDPADIRPSDTSAAGSAGGPGATPGDPLGGGHADHADPDQTAQLIDSLQAEVADLRQHLDTTRAERDEARAAYQRSLADFQNYQRRALANEQQAREQGARGVVLSLMGPLDHFDLALGQNPETATAASVIAGVSMIKDELLRALGAHGIGLVRPAKGEAFDPQKHEAIMQQAAEGVEPGRVVATLRVGYTLNERVVRPAQVSVTPTAAG